MILRTLGVHQDAREIEQSEHYNRDKMIVANIVGVAHGVTVCSLCGEYLPTRYLATKYYFSI